METHDVTDKEENAERWVFRSNGENHMVFPMRAVPDFSPGKRIRKNFLELVYLLHSKFSEKKNNLSKYDKSRTFIIKKLENFFTAEI